MAEPKDSNKKNNKKKRKQLDSSIPQVRSEATLSSQELQERGSVDSPAAATNLQEGELNNNKKEEEKRKRKKKKNKEKEQKEKEKDDDGEGTIRREIEEDPSSSEESKSFTISMAVAGSIVDNAQSMSLASRQFKQEWCPAGILTPVKAGRGWRAPLAGQIARAAAIFRIDEIVVFDDGDEGSRIPKWSEDMPETSGTFLTRILKYMETPQYLRHALVPKHSSLQYAGGLPPLDVPHQARKHEWIPYREGAVTTKPPPSGSGSCVNVGLYEDVLVRQKLPLGTRVTVNMGATRPEPGVTRILDVVPRSEPREKAALYWGYTVRHASCLSTVFSESPYQGGYDYIIGTSEHGQKVSAAELVLPKFKHMMVVFGGVAGLEESKELDTTIKVGDVRHLFNIYLNTCPGQGSRTIRTEEAVLISLQYLQDPFMRALEMPFSDW